MRRYRHVLGILALAVLVSALERVIFPGDSPLMTRLPPEDRLALYDSLGSATGVLLGFVITAIAILISLDTSREIVSELRLGEAFGLLILNMLAAAALLFLVTVLSIGGTVADDGATGSAWLETLYTTVVVAAFAEFALSGFYFALVTYKVAKHS